jgi:hypothetical protein
MSDRNKETIRRIREQAVGKSGAELDILDGLYAADYRYHGGPWGELSGPDAFKTLLQGLSAALQGYSETVVDQVAEGNRVVTRVLGKGRALADLPGIAAGSEFTGEAASFVHFNDAGLIAEEWIFPGEMTARS